MANKNAVPPKAHQVKPGQVLNPRGAGAHKPKLPMQLRTLTLKELEETVNLLIFQSYDTLENMESLKTDTNLKLLIGSVIKRAIDTGDYKALDALLDRLVGKTKLKVEHSGPEGGAIIGGIETEEDIKARQERIKQHQEALRQLDESDSVGRGLSERADSPGA